MVYRHLALCALLALLGSVGARDDLMNVLEFRTCSEVVLAADILLFDTPTLEQALATVAAGSSAASTHRLTFADGSRLFIVVDAFARARSAVLPITISSPSGEVAWRTTVAVHTAGSSRDLQRITTFAEVPRDVWRNLFGGGGLYTISAGTAPPPSETGTLCTAHVTTWVLASPLTGRGP